jgi:hypothetical protein
MRWRAIAAAALLLGAVALSLALPRTPGLCVQVVIPGHLPPPCPSVYGMIPLRITIIVVALIIAVFFVWAGRSARRSRW